MVTNNMQHTLLEFVLISCRKLIQPSTKLLNLCGLALITSKHRDGCGKLGNYYTSTLYFLFKSTLAKMEKLSD